MENVPGTPSTAPSRALEKTFLVLLFVISIAEFSNGGKQFSEYMLAELFNVKDNSVTFVGFCISLTAIIASGLIFFGSSLWWKELLSAKKWFLFGSIGFIIKNIFEFTNRMIVFSIQTSGAQVTLAQIQTLAKKLGGELLQLAFWVFILFYFKSKIEKYFIKNTNTQDSEHA